MEAEQLTLIWSSELVREGENTVRLVARKPQKWISAREAAGVLGCEVWTVWRIYNQGFITGFKPGGGNVRRDGKSSNAPLKLDAESILKYKARQERIAREERGFLA